MSESSRNRARILNQLKGHPHCSIMYQGSGQNSCKKQILCVVVLPSTTVIVEVGSYDSLALEDNLEVGETMLVRYIVKVWGLSGKEFGYFHYLRSG